MNEMNKFSNEEKSAWKKSRPSCSRIAAHSKTPELYRYFFNTSSLPNHRLFPKTDQNEHVPWVIIYTSSYIIYSERVCVCFFFYCGNITARAKWIVMIISHPKNSGERGYAEKKRANSWIIICTRMMEKNNNRRTQKQIAFNQIRRVTDILASNK